MFDVSGVVEIEVGSSRGRFAANGRQLALDVDEPAVLQGLVDLRSLRLLATTLARAGLTLRVRNGDRLLLAAGRGVKAGPLDRLLRLRGVRLDTRFALRSALGRGRSRW